MPAPSVGADADAGEALRSFVSQQVADKLERSGGMLLEERRLVTSLFADLSGITPLADRVDTEDLVQIVDPIITSLTNVVGRYEGHVEKYAGDALLALFGAPVSHEDDAIRALLVAQEMHTELERILPTLNEAARDMTLHIGVNTGHVVGRMIGSEVRTDYSVLGDSIILAQRLESVAPPRETYVGDLTARLARDRFEFEDIGELMLKGKSKPVRAWRILGERVRETPQSSFAGASLVGRDAELAAASSVIDRLVDGPGGALAITGEPGVGKTRLKDAIRGYARGRGVAWLQARCLSYGAGLPYWPYSDLVRRAAGISTSDDPHEAVARLGRELARAGAPDALPYLSKLLGLPSDDAAAVDKHQPEAFRRYLHQLFATWAVGRSHLDPLVIAFEDIHWADESSIELTRELIRLTAQDRICFVLTARPEAAKVVARLEERVPDDLRVHIEISGLDEAGVQDQLVEILGGTVPRELAQVVRERTAGNPLFIEEVVHSLRESGSLLQEGDKWVTHASWDVHSIPPTVEGVLSARIDSLPHSASSVLQVASLIGRRLPLSLIRAAAGDAPDVDASLAHLVESGFLDHLEGEHDTLFRRGFVFHHALIQQVAYDRLLTKTRRQLHARVARFAETLYGAGDDSIDLLARHLYLAGAGTKAIDYLIKAGTRAKRLFANDEAILHLTRAVELARAHESHAEGLPEILQELGDLHELRGHYEDAFRTYSEARDLVQTVDAWRGMASALRNESRFDDALRLLDEAFASNRFEGPDSAPLWLERGWTMMREGNLTDAVEAFEKGLKVGAPADDPIVAENLLQLARTQTVLDRVDEGLRHGLAAKEIFEKQEDLRGLTLAMRIIGDTYRKRGDLDEATAALRHGLELAELTGSVEEIGACLTNLGMAELARNELEAAIECDRRAIEEFERIDHLSGRAIAYGNLAEKLMFQKSFEEALEYCARALDVAGTIGHPPTIADVTKTLSSIQFQQGNYLESAATAEEAAAVFLEMGATSLAADCLTAGAEAMERAGNGERAGQILDQARSLISSPTS
ncbi:MAG: AAA family ATPase [Actinomycetota bacterium]